MRPDDAYTHAWQHADRNADGSVAEESLVRLVAEAIDFDEEKERLGHAQRIVARRRRPGQTAPEGAVVFPGLEPYAYEPHRLLADDDKNLVENQSARMKYKAAEARRAQESAKRALDRAGREQRKLAHYSVWATEQLEAGRPADEVTWDTCIRETGLWKDDTAEPSDDDTEPEDDAA